MKKNIPSDDSHHLTRRQFLESSVAGMGSAMMASFGLRSLGCRANNVTEDGFNSRPNILLLVADDAGWNDVGYHGSEIQTPTIDRLAREGLELDQFYVSPTCSPTRASLLTGRPASRFGILGPIAGKSTLAMSGDTVTLAELLRRNGYATAITGKWHLGLRPEVGPRKYGFEHTYGYLHGQIDQYTHRYKFGGRSWHRNDVFVDEEGHATDLITNEAIRFIENQRNRENPFFLYVPFSVPHYPLQEEEEWIAPYAATIQNPSRRLFAAAMTHMDAAIDRLLKALTTEHLTRNTLVIFMSDNGGQKNWYPQNNQYAGRHGPNDRLGDNRPLRGWKGGLYEGGIRVPAVAYWPSRLKSRTVSTVISVCDLLPTLAYLAGVTIRPEMKIEGENIWPSLASGEKPKERVLYWKTRQQMALRKNNWKLIHHGKTPDRGKDELYNLSGDPNETQNVAADYPEVLAEMRQELQRQFELDS